MTMGLAAYEIICSDAEWRVRREGRPKETKEAAFEAAVAAASLALRGHKIA
jgi:hypothetical protein